MTELHNISKTTGDAQEEEGSSTSETGYEVWCGACESVYGSFAADDEGQEWMNEHAMTVHLKRVEAGPGFSAEVRVAGTLCRCRGGPGRCAKCQ